MNAFKIIKRDLGAQLRWSNNLDETRTMFIKRMFWAFVYLLKGCWVGLKAIRHEQLGSTVIYKGRICQVSNWAGGDSPTLSASGFYQQYCPRSEIKNVFNLREAAHRFNVIFGWYMGSWHAIRVNKKLYPENESQ